MEKRSYFCERNKGESCALSSSPSSFFLFYVCIGRGKLNYEVDCGNHNGYTTTGEVEQMILQFATAVHENSSSFECNSASLHSFDRIFFSDTFHPPRPFILLLPANFGFARGGKSSKVVLSDSWEVDANVPK